jgi:hypothetical protein
MHRASWLLAASPAAAAIAPLLGDVPGETIQVAMQAHALGGLQPTAGAEALLTRFDAIAARVEAARLAVGEIAARGAAFDARLLKVLARFDAATLRECGRSDAQESDEGKSAGADRGDV